VATDDPSANKATHIRVCLRWLRVYNNANVRALARVSECMRLAIHQHVEPTLSTQNTQSSGWPQILLESCWWWLENGDTRHCSFGGGGDTARIKTAAAAAARDFMNR
jgi:hypothetical protein